MDDLVTWLRAQLDDDERVARASTPGYEPQDPMANYEELAHVARWDPARVLAEVDAKRRILDDAEDYARIAQEWTDRGVPQRSLNDMRDTLAKVIRQLALPYADRPGYLDEWRPA